MDSASRLKNGEFTGAPTILLGLMFLAASYRAWPGGIRSRAMPNRAISSDTRSFLLSAMLFLLAVWEYSRQPPLRLTARDTVRESLFVLLGVGVLAAILTL